MKRTFMLGVVLLVPIWLLQRFYEMLHSRQPWVIFTAIVAVAMALGHRPAVAKGGTT
jgi:hypothetical protein